MMFDIKADTICKYIEEMISEHLPIEKMITDQGRQYTFFTFNTLMTKYNIQHNMKTAYNPTGNAISERINIQINKILRLSRKETLNEIKRRTMIRLNYTHHRAINSTPYELLFHKPNFQNIAVTPMIDFI